MTRTKLNPDHLAEMGRILRAQILEHYTADPCIATVAATLETMRSLSIRAYPLAVEVAIVNRPLYEWAETHGRFPAADSDEYPPDGYGIGIGPVETNGVQTGHLVAIAERKFMLDFSLDQASRPEYGIKLHPLVIPIQEPFLRGRAHVVYRYGDAYLYYTAKPGERWFEQSPNWIGGPSAPHVHTARAKQ